MPGPARHRTPPHPAELPPAGEGNTVIDCCKPFRVQAGQVVGLSMRLWAQKRNDLWLRTERSHGAKAARRLCLCADASARRNKPCMRL